MPDRPCMFAICLVMLVRLTSSGESCICVGVHKQLHLEKVADLLRIEHQDALEEHHVSRVHRHRLLLPNDIRYEKQDLKRAHVTF